MRSAIENGRFSQLSNQFFNFLHSLKRNLIMTKDIELTQFKADLLASARELKSGKVARATMVEIPDVVSVRHSTGLSQSQFASLLGVSVRTLQGWEQGRITPSGAARTLITVATKHPEVLRELLAA
jgi:putative transcriptional regulator